ncbi:MAG: MBL fold metallo-hydrolase [Lysinibacillus sp.]
MLNVEILGGVGEYGRNCFYLEYEGRAILLDCGVMNNSEKHLPNLTQAHVAKLDAVFISHSHIDHVGALPLLEKWGYKGRVFMSEMTAKQLKRPYKNTETFQAESMGSWLSVSDRIAFQWGYSGHLIGSVWYKIRFVEKMIFYSGDYVVDSYLLKSSLPTEDGTVYDVALLDSGHVEKRINNVEVLQGIANFVNGNQSDPIILPSSFSGKTADIATYLFQYTTRKVIVDKEFYSFFEDYYNAPENLYPTRYETALKPFKRGCLSGGAVSENTIYVVPERDVQEIEQLLKDYPTAIAINTGYAKEDGDAKQFKEERVKHFFYKTHPDYDDIVELSQKINAKEIIYFHSKLTNRETTLLSLVEK